MNEVHDPVNQPSHYKAGGFEAIDVLEAFFPNDPLGWQVGKYILRYKNKNGLEDLQKAEVYLKRLIEKIANPLIEVPAPAPMTMFDAPENKVYRDKDGDAVVRVGEKVFLRNPNLLRWAENLVGDIEDGDDFTSDRGLVVYGPYVFDAVLDKAYQEAWNRKGPWEKAEDVPVGVRFTPKGSDNGSWRLEEDGTYTYIYYSTGEESLNSGWTPNGDGREGPFINHYAPFEEFK